MDAAFDDRDKAAILSGIFHLQASLADIAEDVWVIRRILEGGDDEEEEEDQTEDR